MESTTDQLAPPPLNAAYDSIDQRRLRLFALTLLVSRHALRSILLVWPLYFVAIMPFLMPVQAGWWIALFIFPAFLVSGYVSLLGARQEYRQHVHGKLLLRENMISLLWGDAESLCQKSQ